LEYFSSAGCYCLLERIEKEQRLMAPLMMMTIMTAMMRLKEEQMVKPHQRRLAAAEKLFHFCNEKIQIALDRKEI
jgi:hypothetical protein